MYKKHSDQLLELISNGPIVVYTCEAFGEFAATSITPNIKDQLGYEPEEFLSEAGFWASKIHPDDRPIVFGNLGHLFENGHHSHDYRFLNKEGVYKWMHDDLRVILSDQQKPMTIVGYWTDITERKQVEISLREAQDELEKRVLERTKELEKSRDTFTGLADNLPIFISLKDPEGRFQFVNKTFEKWVCLNREDIIDKTVFDIYPEEQATEFATRDQEAIDSRSVVSWEAILSYPDGETRNVTSIRFPIISSAHKVIGLGTINIDITEHKVAERQKDEFISTVSHELRTPLTSIKGSLSLIESGALDELPGERKTMISVAYNNCNRLIQLINDILDIEKIGNKEMNFQMKPTKVISLIEEAIEAYKGYGEKHGVTFVKASMEKETLVYGDKDRLMQVLGNLMSNAAKFSTEGEQVELSVTRNNETICIAVKNNGRGIPEEFREKVFERFTQVDSSDTRQEGGTGLGLNISKAIVEQHGGTIDFASEVGVNCTFFFTLPVLE